MSIPRALEHYRAAETALGQQPDSVPLGYLYVGIASAGLWGYQMTEGSAAADRAMAIAESTGNETLWANAAALKGWFLAMTDHLAEGQELLERAWITADRLGHVVGAFFAAWVGAALYAYSWDIPRSGAVLQRELDSGRLTHIPDLQNLLREYLADDELVLGITEPGTAFLEEHANGPKLSSTLQLRVPLVHGDWETALALVEKSVASWREAGVVLVTWMHSGWLAYVRQLLGDTEGAWEALDAAEDGVAEGLPAGPRSFLPLMRARLHLDARDPEAAEHAVADNRESFRREEWPGLAARYDEIDAEIASARGDLVRARELYDRAVAGTTAYPFLLNDAEFELRWARGLAARGESDPAQHVDKAVDLYRRFGFGERWIERAESFIA
jgi:hypothetical protein